MKTKFLWLALVLMACVSALVSQAQPTNVSIAPAGGQVVVFWPV
jgi:hypothetical protein